MFGHRRNSRAIAALLAALIATLGFNIAQPKIAIASGNYAAGINGDSPAGYWRLGETSGTAAADASGHNLALGYQGGYTLGATGAINADVDTAVTFNGTSGYASRSTAPVSATTNWTLEAWVKPAALPQLGTVIYNGIKDTGQGGYGFGIGTTTNTSGSGLMGLLGATGTIDSGYTFPTANQWYHVAMTRDTTTTRFYVNGAQTSKTSTTAPTAPGARFSLGAATTSANAVTRPFSGTLDEVAIYGSAVANGRLAAHYDEAILALSGMGKWISVTPATSPTARYGSAVTYDPVHSNVVLFGGTSASGAALNDTWLWNGTTWSKPTPTTIPTVRTGAVMAWDAATNSAVMFGGNSGSTYLSETWTWDGSNWTKKSPATVPGARTQTVLGYNSSNNTIQMFSGRNGNTYLNDTWKWDGTNWTKFNPASPPGVRAQAAGAYMPAANKLVVFGGYNGSSYQADTWTWDGTSWSQLSPPTAPSGRAGAAYFYDATTSTLQLYGGWDGAAKSELWSWDGAVWAKLAPPSPPSAREWAAGAYDTATSSGVLFGGYSGTAALADNWSWTTPPGAPTNPGGTAGNGQVSVTWNTPTSNGGQAITGYTVIPFNGSSPGTPVSAAANATGASVNGLTNGTAYTFAILASNSVGSGLRAVTSPITPLGPPGAPTNVSAQRGNAQAVVSWIAPTSTGGSPITGYVATPYTNNGNTAGTPVTFNSTSTTQTMTGLTNGTAYWFAVSAINNVGTGPASAKAGPVTPITVADAPTSVTASRGNGQATVSWTAPANNGGSAITGYVVTPYTNNGNTAGTPVTFNTTATSQTLAGLTNGTAYNFTVAAINGAGTGPASSQSPAVTPATVPTAPSGVSATAGNAQATVSWTAPSSDGGSAITAYVVTPYTNNGTLPGTPTTFNPAPTTQTVTGLTNGTSYTFTVAAVNSVGTSPASAQSGAVTPITTAGAPTGVSATAGDAQATVNWTAPADSGGSPITGYTVTPITGGTPGTPVNVGAAATSVVINGLVDGSSYTFTVAAVNSAGTGPAATSNAVTPMGLPGSPSGVSATAGAAQATVTWTAPAFTGGSAITGYVVTPYTNNGQTAGTPVTFNSPATSQTVTGLTNGTSYTFTVAAINSMGTGPASAQSSAVTPMAPPEPPTNVTASAGNAQATASWAPPSSNGGSALTGYTVTPYIGSTAGTPVTVGPSTLTTTITGLTNGTAYTFQVYATNSVGNGTAASSGAVTPATLPGSPTAVTATGGNAQATVSWNVPSTDGGAAITGYVVTPYVGATAQTATTYNSAATSETVSGLTNGTAYTFTVAAINAVGTGPASTASNAITPSAMPGAPTNVAAAGGNTQATVSWTPPGSSGGSAITGYTVTPYVGSSPGAPVTVGASNTTATVTGLNNGTIYTFQVFATNAYGNGASGTSNLVKPGYPDAPTGVLATAGLNQATVSWTPGSGGGFPITSYKITAFAGSTARNATNVASSSTSVVISGLSASTSYTFQVYASNQSGAGLVGTSNAVTPTGTSATYASTVLGDGPSIYYRLDDGMGLAADSSGNGREATYNGGTQGSGGALVGDTDTAETGSVVVQSVVAGLPLGASARSLEIWMKQGGDGALMGYGSAGGTNQVYLYVINGNQLTIDFGNGPQSFAAPYPIENNTWHLVVAAYDGTNVTMYLDGQSLGSKAVVANTTAGSALLLGRNPWCNCFYNGGTMDEAAVYPSALSAAQVLNHFNTSGNGRPSAPGNLTATAGVNGATLSWTASTAPGSAVIGYEVRAYSGSTPQNSTWVVGTATGATITGLAATAHTFQVTPLNGFGLGATATSNAVTPTGTSATYASTVLGDGPSIYYRLDDGIGLAADSSGNSREGVYGTSGYGNYMLAQAGGLGTDPDGAVTFTADFGGAGRVQPSSSAGLPGGNSPRTLEAWFKTSSSGRVVSYGSQNNGQEYEVIVNGNNLLTVAGYNDDLNFPTTYAIENNTWHHVIASYDGTNVTVYLDGQNLGSQAPATQYNTTAANLNVGADVTGSSGFAGTVDEAAVYPSALSQTQATAHFNMSGNGRPSAPGSLTATTGLNQATLSWTASTAPGSPVSGYEVRAYAGSSPQNSTWVVGTATGATVTGLATTAYTFQVTPLNGFGFGATATSNAVTPTGTSATYASTVMGDHPAYYYRLDDGLGLAADSSGNNRDGVYGTSGYGTYTLAQAGGLGNDADRAVGFSADFSGAGRVQPLSAAGLPGGNSPRTLEAWFQTTRGGRVVSYGSQNNSQEYEVIVNGNNLLTVAGYNDDLNFPTTYAIENNTWHHVIASYDGTNVTVYLDGQSLGSQAPATLYNTSAGNLNIGADVTGGSGAYGSVDEAAVYPTALNQTQATAHFNASGNSKPTAPGSVTAIPAANQLTVSWTASSAGGSPVSAYIVRGYLGANPQNAVSVPATATSAILTGLKGGSAYTVQVIGVNGFGYGAAGSSSPTTPGGPSTTYVATILGDNPSAYYRLGDSGPLAADSSSAGRVGTYTGGTRGVGAGIVNDAGTGSGGNGPLMSSLASDGFPAGSADRTIETWFNTTQSSFMTVASNGAFGDTQLFALQLNGGNSVVLTGWNDDLTFTNASPFNDGLWHHLAITVGGSGSTITVFLDGSSIGTQTLGRALNTQATSFTVGARPDGTNSFTGSLDDVAVYPAVLSGSQIANHVSVGNPLLGAPTNVTASAGANQATVRWSAPSGGVPTTYYVTAFVASGPSTTITAPGNTTVANFSTLAGNQSYTFAVRAANAYRMGPQSAMSGSVTVAAPAVGPTSLGQYLYVRSQSLGGLPGSYYGFVTDARVPAMSSWTIEGYIGNLGSGLNTGSNHEWGVLDSTNNYSTVAGIHMNIGGNPLQSFFVWPGGQWGMPSDGVGEPAAGVGAVPGYFALSYDGSTVRGFINGSLVFSQATGSAALPTNYAGFVDHDGMVSGSLDEFRISSTSRYSSSFTPPATAFAADGSTNLLAHFNDYGITALPPDNAPNMPGQVAATIRGVFGDDSGHSNFLDEIAYGVGCVGCGYYAGPTYYPYSLGQGVTADEITGGGSPWMCMCKRDETHYPISTATGEFYHTFDDINVPGRGLPLDLKQTYSSLKASQLGREGYGWADSYGINLTFGSTGSPPISTATVHAGNGSANQFNQVGSNWVAPSHVLATLDQAGGTYTFTDKEKTVMIFDSSGKLLSETDRNGYVTTLSYNANNQLATVTDPSNRTLTFGYYASGLVQTVTDTAGRSVGFTYDGSNNLQQLTDVGGNHTTFTYDSAHRMLTMKDPNCIASGCSGVVNVYDGAGRVTQQTDDMGRVWKFSYANGSTTITDPNGNQGLDAYAGNILFSATKATGSSQPATTKYSYDPFSLGLTATIDPNGNATTMTRDNQANVLSSTDPLGRTTSYTYNSFSEPLTMADPVLAAAGQHVAYSYDSNGNLQQVSRPLVGGGNSVTAYSYGDSNHLGDVTGMTDPDSKTWSYSYDQYGNVASAQDPLGDKTTYTYDSASRMRTKVTPRGNVNGGNPAAYTTTYTPNAYGDVLTVVDPLSRQTQNQYDLNRNLQSVMDANNHTTTYTYNADNQLRLVTRPDNSTLQTGYDANGNILSQTDGLGNPTTYVIDALNRVASVQDPAGRRTSYGYDAVGNRVSTTDPQGQKTSYGFDSANELLAVSYSDGVTPGVSMSYDADGQRQSMTDGTGTTSYTVDSLHRLTQQQTGAGKQVTYGYDLKGQLTDITYPGQSTPVHRGYDDAGRMTSVKDYLNNQTTLGYDENGNLKTVVYPNGTSAAWGPYDAADQLSSITDTGPGGQFLNLSYSRDQIGQLQSENSTTYAYDPTNRLTTMNGSAGSWAYDAGDNLTKSPTATQQVYDTANELCWSSTGTPVQSPSCSAPASGATAYGYDARGNRTSTTPSGGGGTTFSYDQANRLSAVGSTANYGYNGDGLRMSKTVGGTTGQQTWDVAEGLPLLIQDDTTNYITGPGGLPLEQVSSGGVTYFHLDHLGSVRALTNQSGTVVGTASYDAYGKLSAGTGTLLPFQFAGQYLDAESGFYYLRARYYDASTGQFISRDPAFSMTRQPYAYVGDNPLNSTDPSGLMFATGLEDTSSGNLSVMRNGNATPANPLSEYNLKGLSKGLDVLSAVAAGTKNCAGVMARVPALRAARYELGGIPLLEPLAGGLAAFGDMANGESAPKAFLKAGLSTGLSTAGESLGAAACVGETAETLGIGVEACPLFIGGGALAGGLFGDFVGGKIADAFNL